eukprot:3948799-Alexandrium_andersonii.AAC.1
MSASLVGSEMCIRDRSSRIHAVPALIYGLRRIAALTGRGRVADCTLGTCLLYTSDAADDM